VSIRLEIKRVTSSDLDLLNQLYTEMDGELPMSLLEVEQIFHSKSAVIDAVIVTCGYRNQGIGKAMMHEALKLSREAGCYKAMLSSNLKRTNAHQFYKSLGFKQQGWSFSLEL
jgi:GNAT superfamily N-acetyltransferase